MIARHASRTGGKLKVLPLEWLERGRLQPRRIIDGAALKRLAESIRLQGVIQPIFVRKKRRGKFEIIAGERRWHAAKIAGLTQIPSVVSNVSDQAALAIALIENLHREDLNPIDQAVAIRRLTEEFGMTHKEIGECIGRSRTAVSNLLRLLELPVAVQDMVADGALEMGHARALLALPEADRESRAKFVAERHLTVRAVEAMAKRRGAEANAALEPTTEHAVRDDVVSIQRQDDGRYQVRFDFRTKRELREAIRQLRAFADGLA